MLAIVHYVDNEYGEVVCVPARVSASTALLASSCSTMFATLRPYARLLVLLSLWLGGILLLRWEPQRVCPSVLHACAVELLSAHTEGTNGMA